MGETSKILRIGDNIKRYRVEKGLTQSELATKCNMKDTQLRRYELNQTVPRKEQLERLAKALDVEVTDLKNEIHVFRPKINLNFPQLFAGIDKSQLYEGLEIEIDNTDLTNNNKLNYFGEFLRVNNIKFTACKKNDVSGKIFSLNDEYDFKYFLTDEQARMLPEMTIEQVKSLIRSLDQLNNKDLFSE